MPFHYRTRDGKEVCPLCGKKFGFLEEVYPTEDGLVCILCYKMQQMQKTKEEYSDLLKKKENKKVMEEYIRKYLSNKSPEFQQRIKEFSSGNDLQMNPLETLREKCRTCLSNLKTMRKDMSIEDIVSSKETVSTYLIILNDLEKLLKLFVSKGIDTNYLEILSIFDEILTTQYNTGICALVNEMYTILSQRLGTNISKESVIRELIKIRINLQKGIDVESNPEVVSIYEVSKRSDPSVCKADIIEKIKSSLRGKNIELNIDKVSGLFAKFDLSYTEEEIKQLIRKIKEEIEIEEFEKDMGVQVAARIKLDDFRDLSGHEFEEYIQKLFELLGYTTIRTPLTGDQGADLIVSKNSQKTVIQLKKHCGSISNKAIQEIVAAKNYYKADKAMVIVSTSFTSGAVDLALANDVELWDGEKLRKIISDVNIV